MRGTRAKRLRKLAYAFDPSAQKTAYKKLKFWWSRRNLPKPNMTEMIRALKKRRRAELRNAKRAYAKEQALDA